MRRAGGVLKPVRGKCLPLSVQPNWSSEQLLAAATKKQKDFNQDLDDGPYIMLYPDGTDIQNIPGTDKPFTVQLYREAVGRPYQRITFFICKVEDFLNNYSGDSSSSEDVSEVHVRTCELSDHSSLHDTLVWDSPDDSSTPVPEGAARFGPSRTAGQVKGQVTAQEDAASALASSDFYSTYTHVYAPIVIHSDSDPEEVYEKSEEESIDGLTAEDVVSNLSAKIIRSSCSRFNINRANIWDGAFRGFKRASYNPEYDMLVKFTDDEGQYEDAVDVGGPKREFLSLLMDCLKTRRIFDGPENRKFLTFDSDAARNDEYFLAGRMIAVSLVHGGPGPRFLSQDLYQYLAGKEAHSSTASVEDISDEQMKASLLEIANAQTLDELHSSTDRHSSLLQTAGCFQYPKTLENKENIIKDFMQWYIIYRNHFSIQRFKEGLSTLDVVHALEQHTSIFRPFMCYSEERLSAATLETLFTVQLSAVGSSRRQEENRVLGYWRDYLLDTEEHTTKISLKDLLRFATGLNAIPPSAIRPQPNLSFETTSCYPVASTCSNTIRIPFSKTYDKFKADMDFGILNSPGFGLY